MILKLCNIYIKTRKAFVIASGWKSIVLPHVAVAESCWEQNRLNYCAKRGGCDLSKHVILSAICALGNDVQEMDESHKHSQETWLMFAYISVSKPF